MPYVAYRVVNSKTGAAYVGIAGHCIPEAAKAVGVATATFYNWVKHWGPSVPLVVPQQGLSYGERKV